MRFRPNQEIVCVVDGVWETVVERRFLLFWKRMRIERGAGPRMHQVVTVVGYDGLGMCVKLKEFPPINGKHPAYDEHCFIALSEIEITELASYLHSQ